MKPSELVNLSAEKPTHGAMTKLAGGIIFDAADPRKLGPTIHNIQHVPSIASRQPRSFQLYCHHSRKFLIEFEVALIEAHA